MPLHKPPTADDAEHARLRFWAAEVGDAGGAHAEDAALLCKVLDLHAYMSERARRPESAAKDVGLGADARRSEAVHAPAGRVVVPVE